MRRAVRDVFRRLIWRPIWRTFHFQIVGERECSGMVVRVREDTLRTMDCDASLNAVDDALALMARYSPRHLRRIQQELEVVEIDALGAEIAQFEAAGGACIIDPSLLRTGPVANVASTIVHEATHARLDRLGFVYSGIASRDRIERICMREEVAFLRLIPGAEELADHYQEIADSDLRWYTKADELQRRADRLRAVGAPRVIVRWLEYRAAKHRPPAV